MGVESQRGREKGVEKTQKCHFFAKIGVFGQYFGPLAHRRMAYLERKHSDEKI